VLGQALVDQAELAFEEVDVAQAGRDRLALVLGQRLRSQPPPTLYPKEIGSRRTRLQVADQDRVHLILLARALPHQLRPARDTTPEHPRRLVDDPHLGQKPAGQQLRQRPRVDLVRLRRLRRPLHRLAHKQIEPRRATRQLRIRARSTSGQSQGRPTTNRGLAAHSVIRRPA
jgi:hypothetical protein